MKCQNRLTGEKVAIKLIEQNQQSYYSSVKIIREIKILRKLSEDNYMHTTRLLDIITPDEDSIFLVMTLGKMDLFKFINGSTSKNMKETHIITILYNLLCATNYLHSMNLIHRDLKPANILIN